VTIESVIYARLSGFAGLTALVSTRCYPNIAPQNVTVPFVTWRRVSAVRASGMGQDTGIVSARMQLDVFASTYLQMRAVSDQVRQALQRYRASGTDPEVLDTFMLNELDLFDDVTDLHHGVTDVMIHYREV
jgi:hypothetical protein